MQRRSLLLTLSGLAMATAMPLFAHAAPATLRVMTHSSFDLPKELLAQFEKDAGVKLQVVKAMEGQAFFNMVRGKCVVSLYDNEMAYQALGYPGSAWEKGGYITRGFQDLKWLPNPHALASPAPYMG